MEESREGRAWTEEQDNLFDPTNRRMPDGTCGGGGGVWESRPLPESLQVKIACIYVAKKREIDAI
jgi:hypothetical protein